MSLLYNGCQSFIKLNKMGRKISKSLHQNTCTVIDMQQKKHYPTILNFSITTQSSLIFIFTESLNIQNVHKSWHCLPKIAYFSFSTRSKDFSSSGCLLCNMAGCQLPFMLLWNKNMVFKFMVIISIQNICIYFNKIHKKICNFYMYICIYICIRFKAQYFIFTTLTI